MENLDTNSILLFIRWTIKKGFTNAEYVGYNQLQVDDYWTDGKFISGVPFMVGYTSEEIVERFMFDLFGEIE